MRGGPKITRNDYTLPQKADRVDWLDDFAEKFANQQPKDAVEAARIRDQKANSVYDQISQIMGNKNRKNYTVQGVVNEYRERLGLDKLSQPKEINVKKAEILSDSSKIFNNLNLKIKQKILEDIDSIINKYNGYISSSAITNTLLSDTNHQLTPEDVKNDYVQKYISDRKAVYESQHPSKEDVGNAFKKDVFDDNDNETLFNSLQPAKK